MAQFQIVVGSVLGASEYVADALQELLTENGHQVGIHLTPDVNELNLTATLIVCTSTHGAGDLPDNIEPFAKQLKTAKLSELSFLIVGLGDSSYDTFCNGAMQMEDLLIKAGATLLAPAIHIDVLNHPIPEDNAVEWLQNWLEQ